VSCTADARLRVRIDATSFHVEIELDTSEDGAPFVSRRWDEVVARDLL
jgi:hypothetical protein